MALTSHPNKGEYVTGIEIRATPTSLTGGGIGLSFDKNVKWLHDLRHKKLDGVVVDYPTLRFEQITSNYKLEDGQAIVLAEYRELSPSERTTSKFWKTHRLTVTVVTPAIEH